MGRKVRRRVLPSKVKEKDKNEEEVQSQELQNIISEIKERGGEVEN